MHKKIITSLVSIGLFLGAALANPTAEEESPQEGLKAIVELYRTENWEGLVKERCLDTRHAQSAEEVQKLVQQLSSQFSEDDSLSALVTSYQAALSAEPQIEQEGSVAIFASETGSVRLSKMENGAWGLRF